VVALHTTFIYTKSTILVLINKIIKMTKRIDFSKIKKYGKKLVGFFSNMFKKQYSEEKVKLIENITPLQSNNSRKGGYKYYTHYMQDIKGIKPEIYRSFRKQILPDAKIIIGKTIYKVIVNPYFSG